MYYLTTNYLQDPIEPNQHMYYKFIRLDCQLYNIFLILIFLYFHKKAALINFYLFFLL